MLFGFLFCNILNKVRIIGCKRFQVNAYADHLIILVKEFDNGIQKSRNTLKKEAMGELMKTKYMQWRARRGKREKKIGTTI